MDRQKKDELIALWRDAVQGFWWTIGILAFMALISFFWDLTAQTRITVANGVFGSDMTSSITAQHQISPVFALAIHENIWTNHNDLAFEIKTDMTKAITGKQHKYQIDAITGIGWGHYFYDGPADHNYHTYHIGLDCYRHFEDFSIVLTPMVICRTWQEHIGLHRPTFMATIGIATTL